MNDLVGVSYVLLWALVIALLIGVVGIGRQLAILTARVGGRDDEPLPGRALDSPGPAVHGRRLDGTETTISAPFRQPVAILFMSDSCVMCESLFPGLEATLAETAPNAIWVVTNVEPTAGHPLASGVLGQNVVVAPDAFRDWEVKSVPFGFVMRTDGTVDAKGNLPHLGHLRETLGLPVADPRELHSHEETWERGST